jgi:hypothetical protein
MVRNKAIAVLAGALLASAALAQQKAERPQVSVGDTWLFAVYYTVPSAIPNRTWIVTRVSPERIEGTENGEPLLLTPELNVLESPRHKESNPRGLSFPLEVGKRWRYESEWLFKAKGSKGRSVVDVAVVAFEPVSTPAGEFEAFRLVATGKLSGNSPINSRYDAETSATYWYAPEARAVVRSVYHNPYLGTSTVELADFRPRR